MTSKISDRDPSLPNLAAPRQACRPASAACNVYRPSPTARPCRRGESALPVSEKPAVRQRECQGPQSFPEDYTRSL